MSQIEHLPISADDLRHQFHEIQVYDVVRETADAASFVFEVPSDLEKLFRYRPGQFLTFEIPWKDFEIKRCYSLSSCASWGEKPKVTVKRVADGRASNWMNDELAPGMSIRVMPPAGHFVLDADHARANPLTLFSGGSGITPVISLIKQALRETKRNLKLVYANRDVDSIIFRAELEAIEAQYAERLEVVHHLDDARGFLSEHDVAGHIEGRLDSDFYICGPTPFMDTIEHVLEELPRMGGEIHIERFVSAVDPDRRPEVPAQPEPPSSGLPDKVTVVLGTKRHEVAYHAGETVLQAAVRAGLDVPYSCQDGYCSCCMAKLLQGEVQMASREALTDREIHEGWVLTCQAKPTTSVCEVEYED